VTDPWAVMSRGTIASVFFQINLNIEVRVGLELLSSYRLIKIMKQTNCVETRGGMIM
jgi:hypothetical protein